MKLGDAFTMATPPSNVRHLFFIISDPTLHGGTFLVVNITKNYIRASRECVLQKGDHKWIRYASYVSFRDAIEVTPPMAIGLNAKVGREIGMEDPLAPHVLQRIVAAARVSRSLQGGFKKYL